MSEEKGRYLIGLSEKTAAPAVDPYLAQQKGCEQKMREALERIANMAAQYHGVFAARIIEIAVEALAQQPAAGVELTDDEIAKAMGWSDLAQLDEITYDGIATSVLIKDIRAAIAAHEAKRNGGGV